jgi:hypothetical protein
VLIEEERACPGNPLSSSITDIGDRVMFPQGHRSRGRREPATTPIVQDHTKAAALLLAEQLSTW